MFLKDIVFVFPLIVLLTAEADQLYGRHVCSHQQNVAVPIPIQQSYIRAIYKKDTERTIYQTAYKTVFKMQIRSENVSGCCPGWEKKSPRDANCMKPVCDEGCENEGVCVGPDLCVCGDGYTGYKCHIDIDECTGRNTCQQKCTNMPGSYECSCQDGFLLAEDEYSCELCVSCTEDFKSLYAQVEELSNVTTFQNNAALEVSDKMVNLTLLLLQAETIQNIQIQLANLSEITVPTERFEELVNDVDTMKESIKKVDIIPELNSRIDILQENSLHTDMILEIENRINNLTDVKVIVETVQSLNDTIRSLLEDDSQTRHLQEIQKQLDDLVLSKAQQDEAQADKLLEMHKELEQLREINVLQETLHDFKGELHEVSGRVDELVVDKADQKLEVTIQAERFEYLQKDVNTLKEVIKKVDIIPQLNTRIDNLQEFSVHTDKLLQIQNRIDDFGDVKVITESIHNLNDTVQHLLEDDSKTKQLEEMKKQIDNLMLNKAQQEQDQADRFEKLQTELEQLREVRALTVEVQNMKDTIQLLTNRIQDLEADKAALKRNLTDAVTNYEAAISALHVKEVANEHLTTDPYELDQKMPLDRLVSLSEQISILEERMADCACNQDYSRG